MCDSNEMRDALNLRVGDARIQADTPRPPTTSPRTPIEGPCQTGVEALLIDRRTHNLQPRQADYRQWGSTTQEQSAGHEHCADQHLHQSFDDGLEL